MLFLMHPQVCWVFFCCQWDPTRQTGSVLGFLRRHFEYSSCPQDEPWAPSDANLQTPNQSIYFCQWSWYVRYSCRLHESSKPVQSSTWAERRQSFRCAALLDGQRWEDTWWVKMQNQPERCEGIMLTSVSFCSDQLQMKDDNIHTSEIFHLTWETPEKKNHCMLCFIYFMLPVALCVLITAGYRVFCLNYNLNLKYILDIAA